jgi:hypothetical protein
LGFEGTSARLNNRFKSGDLEGMAATITNEILEHFAVVGRWDEIADRLIERYRTVATRMVAYHAAETIGEDPETAGRWGEIAKALEKS